MKWTELTTKKARIELLREKLSKDSQWAIKGLMAVYAKQTADEQSSLQTSRSNGIGFSGFDAELLSSFAQRIKAGKSLTDKQMAIVFKRMPRYAAQLERMSK